MPIGRCSRKSADVSVMALASRHQSTYISHRAHRDSFDRSGMHLSLMRVSERYQ